MDTMRPVQEEQTPREVVLSYRPEPEPVVLRYEIPLPPGMCAQPEPEEPAEPAEEPAASSRRSRRKLATFAALAGCVLLLAPSPDTAAGEVQTKLAQAAAAFLGRQLEE